jgi:hypothetical protein
MINSPGLVLFSFSAALELPRKTAAKQIVDHVFVFFIATFVMAELVVMTDLAGCFF